MSYTCVGEFCSRLWVGRSVGKVLIEEFLIARVQVSLLPYQPLQLGHSV